ncbi:hypothetical protein WJX74_006130 [Apatococcus lobatus]|uniref:Uncharacterized protein n=1 Tax=Apatococcus lobatus TaxID=904363 RepID=A0AAW1QJM0_9CHLO
MALPLVQQSRGFSASRPCRTLLSKPSTSRVQLNKPARAVQTQASLLDSVEDPLFKAALQEPVAFWGGAFAGILGLDLKQDPLKSWLERTSTNAGVAYQMQLNKYQTEQERRQQQMQPQKQLPRRSSASK